MKKLWFVFLIVFCVSSSFAFAQPAGETEENDGPLSVDAYFGTAVDSFAASELKDYLNPEDSGDTSAFSRSIFGINFELEMGKHFYLGGETLHGVRSADVDCSDEQNSELCQDLLANPTREGTLAILKSASSLEAFVEVGARFPIKDSPVDFHVVGRAGFITVAESGGDVLDNHFVGGGVGISKGLYEDSYLEVGWGRSQFFQVNPNRRVKIEGMLSFPLNKKRTVKLFAQMVVDSDFSDGADSIQSFYGVYWDMKELMKKIGGTED